MKVCFIFGAGEFFGTVNIPRGEDFIIAADGGYRWAMNSGFLPDVCIGDFDSSEYVPNHPNVIKLNREKDDTDMFAAISLGLERGYTDFELYGGTGGRIEHTLANIQHLAYLCEQGAHGRLYGNGTVITAIKNEAVHFEKSASGYISVFSHTDTSSGVYEKGLKYSLDNATLDNKFPLGVSNEFIGAESEISVRSGTLIIVRNAVTLR